ncbi:ABC transporter permease [Enterococcus termitis]|uniref:Iron export ABC transporter permease subunit FetB n=1 Tax=Enterococcus termitis TaxID=332950 RepID=A0A1E5G8R5_9ENTE|nr:iron export ABC transporter permease subunit FetB [Enterococcus termitis]OEG09104.1 iron export ABC transporter permease subunit FetB [Enterococcus termitis]
MNLAVNDLSLLFASMLVIVALLISYKEKLGFTKDIIISVCRAVIQLILVGYLLKYIFQVDNKIVTIVMAGVIIINAALNAKKRSNHLKNGFLISFIAIVCSTGVTIGVLVFSGAIRFIPSQIIPISGMIASNSMVAIGLCYRNMDSLFHDQRQAVLEKLALGADIKLASQSIVRASIRTGMAPTIDSAKTVGIVSLPGMMSGLIFAGVDPVHAIKYQIMVTFMLLSATSIGSVIATYFAYKEYYNERKQLIS